MRKFFATILFIIGLVFSRLAYSCYSEYRYASNTARFYDANPGESPPVFLGVRQSREEYIAESLMRAGENRNLALLSGAGSLLLCIGGAALFFLGGRKDTFIASPKGGLNENPMQRPEAMNRWAGVALARPVEVHFKKTYAVLFVLVIVFFIGISLIGIAVNGFTSTSVLILILNALFSSFFYYIQSRARKKLASVFDCSGVTCRANRRFNWSEFKSVDYRMAIKPRSGREYLWRIELVFNSGEAWIIPRRVKNWNEIESFVATLPGTHRKRMI